MEVAAGLPPRGSDGRVRQELAAGVGRSLIIAQIAAPAFLGHNHRLKKSHSLPIVDGRIIQTRGRSCGGLSDPFGRAAMHDFIKRFAGGVFFPEEVEILVAAFDDAWAKLQSSRAPFAEEAYAPAAQEILAKHIIMAAQRGERNPRQLTYDALFHLAWQLLSKELPA